MFSFHTRDLLGMTLLVAATLAVASFAVAFREFSVTLFSLAIPLPVTAVIQRRYALDWRVATALHYPVAITWAFCFGVAYSLAWGRTPQTFFDRDSVGLNAPWQFGLFLVQVMCVVGLASTVVYGLGSWLHASRVTRNRSRDRE